jgi:fatty acid-binding protein DegV
MRHVAKINSEFGIDRYTIVHSANPELAEQYANMCEEIIGKKPLYMTPISAVTTIHSGIGSVAISLVRGR